MPFARSIAVSLLAALLAGCLHSGRPGAIQSELPPLPGTLALDCHDPGVRADRPVLVEFAHNRLALADCRRRHRDTVSFYDDLRQGATGQGKSAKR